MTSKHSVFFNNLFTIIFSMVFFYIYILVSTKFCLLVDYVVTGGLNTPCFQSNSVKT